MKHVRRSLMLVAGIATMLVASAGTAMAQTSYPLPPPAPGAAATSGAPAAGASGRLAFTGSDLKLVWVALVLLVIGLVLFVATRRRASLRRRGALSEALS